MKKDFVVVDIETTGLSYRLHKITEIAAVRIKNHKVIDEFQSLINPRCHIPSFITNLTGISDEMVKYSPTIDKIISHFNDFLGNDVFIAHNATFDFNFLEHNSLKHTRQGLNNQVLCTKRLANRLLPELPSKRLGLICEHLNIENKQAHRAMSDVLATVDVFNHFHKLMKKKDITDIDAMLKFQSSKIPRIEF